MSSFYFKLFVILIYICVVEGDEFDNMLPSDRFRYRHDRNCKHRHYSSLDPFYRKSIFESTVYLVFIILLGILFGLMLLGCIKGIIGILGSKKIGEYGMTMLIDLPKPLNAYRESELRGRQVCYDVVGWPVHPDTGERTVRMLPTKTEFFLNAIFFLAYPLAIILKVCSICCCIRDFKREGDECFRAVNVIKCNRSKKDSAGPEVDVYKENDLREAKDTNYVINCMRQSQMSLEKLRLFKEMR